MSDHLDLGTFRRDGRSDEEAFRACFLAAARAGGGTIRIPPGSYALTGLDPIPLPSATTVQAHGAHIDLPEQLGERPHRVLFAGRDLTAFAWHGGSFHGYCFDPAKPDGPWGPQACTRAFAITTSPGGRTADLLFEGIRSEGLAGAVVNVEGAGVAGSESGTDTFAERIAVRDCTFLSSGIFMWDYGLLWQILTWPEDHSPEEQAMAQRHFRNDLLRAGLRMAEGDDRIVFDNAREPVPTWADDHERGTITLLGALPRNLVRGRRYHVVESGPGHLRIADSPDGAAIRFASAAGPDARLIADIHHARNHLYRPLGSGPGKGCIDLVCCRGTSLSGNRISARGDTMHLQRCCNNVFTGNQILGSRMGAFFLAEHCCNSTVTGNTIDGTNGSRVMSVERSNRDVTIVGNTFRGGGRGSWINQPLGLILQGNLFTGNTTKCEADPRRGRRCDRTGGWESWAEMYFTTWQPGAGYGPVVLNGNIFDTAATACDAIGFAAGGRDVLVDGNLFTGAVRTVRVDPGCTVRFGDNPGMVLR